MTLQQLAKSSEQFRAIITALKEANELPVSYWRAINAIQAKLDSYARAATAIQKQEKAK